MSLYNQVVPVFIKYLNNLSAMLDKAVAYCDEKGISYDDMLSFRLIEDQQGLPFQVQCCSNTAKLAIQRLGNTSVPVFEDTETTFPELKARIERTIEVLKTADPASMDGLEAKELVMETKMGTFKFETGQRYVSEFAMANFHFHLSTAYCILRHRGVPLGALDYMKDVMVKA